MNIPKTFPLLAAAFLAFLSFGALTPPHARADVSVSFFYDSLDPYGEWVQDPDYGYCWHPTGVDENWAPYTDGYWAYTDSGWTWVSYEDYGGVVYHYGRWAHVRDEGWIWVPGKTWAPAWVSWRTNDDYVGWAPLPPEARWDERVGFSTWVDGRFDIGPGFYSFVGVRDFGAPALGAVILSRDRNVEIINNTTNITNITVNNTNVYVGGPSYARIAGRTARPIPTLKLVRQATPGQGGKLLSHQQGNQLVVLAPRVTAPEGNAHPAPSKVAKTLTGAQADHGWDVVKDPQEREKLHAHLKDQSAGSENAKPVNPDDLKVVSQRARGATVAEHSATPATAPGRDKKDKIPSTTELENAPATEAPAAAMEPLKTPKGKKSKTPDDNEGISGTVATPNPRNNRKSHAASQSSFTDTGASTDGAPIPKKSKQSRTPSDDGGGFSDSEQPSKHSKKSTDSNLQPFMGGDAPEPRARRSSEASGNAGSSQGRSAESGNPSGQAKTPKGDKGGKSDKKNKDDQGVYPPGQ